MPAKNSIKVYVNESFYHVYNRGVNKQEIFLEESDYVFFLGLLKRYLSPEKEADSRGALYPSFYDSVELLAYCLMPNHFHLLLYQTKDHGITELMRSLSASYCMYFNRKYGRVGPIFQGKFKASRISSDSYLQHISRYIHLNPKNFEAWKFSSLSSYMGEYNVLWVKPGKILELFDNDRKNYLEFVRDYAGQKKIMDELKYELAQE